MDNKYDELMAQADSIVESTHKSSPNQVASAVDVKASINNVARPTMTQKA